MSGSDYPKIPVSDALAMRADAALAVVRQGLLGERVAAGHWEGELSTSSLSTATAVSALCLLRDQMRSRNFATSELPSESEISRWIADGSRWLMAHQNEDGGFGDTDRSYSNIATTMLVIAALTLAKLDGCEAVLQKANAYVDQQGHIRGLRARYGKDKTFVVPILTNCALAGLVSWKEIPALPFELACVPQSWYRFVNMPVVSYAIPALVAIGQAHFFHVRPWNPLLYVIRKASIGRSLKVLQTMQPQSGGYLEATPLTSFVLMSLASMGMVDHPVVVAGVRFLKDSIRPDGSWPIDTNLATWVTTLSINALADVGENPAEVLSSDVLDWVLKCQHQQRHPFTGADPGGFGWTDLSGAVPDADDTPGALLALAAWDKGLSKIAQAESPSVIEQRKRIASAASKAIDWLYGLQNRDGGWPTFCRGFGTLPFDRSGVDLTAHALRALHAWKPLAEKDRRFAGSVSSGEAYIWRHQRKDGSWLPLWFGNQDHPEEENPIYGTSKVLKMGVERNLLSDPRLLRGARWLASVQNANGTFGSSLEETALATEMLGSWVGTCSELQVAYEKGLAAICEVVELGEHRRAAPIGFYFAKLWYYERLYPLILSLSAVGRRGSAS
ncbi:MAG: prenyltransferase/squalene oxidase repeat-containing protein [Planctomycetaceae bacterium]